MSGLFLIVEVKGRVPGHADPDFAVEGPGYRRRRDAADLEAAGAQQTVEVDVGQNGVGEKIQLLPKVLHLAAAVETEVTVVQRESRVFGEITENGEVALAFNDLL